MTTAEKIIELETAIVEMGAENTANTQQLIADHVAECARLSTEYNNKVDALVLENQKLRAER